MRILLVLPPITVPLAGSAAEKEARGVPPSLAPDDDDCRKSAPPPKPVSPPPLLAASSANRIAFRRDAATSASVWKSSKPCVNSCGLGVVPAASSATDRPPVENIRERGAQRRR